MSVYGLVRPVSGRAFARNRLRIGTALGGPLSLLLLTLPNAAMAQNQCGAAPVGGGAVTCGDENNPYPTGIVYTTPVDLTINVDSDVVVNSGAMDAVRLIATAPAVDAVVNVGDGATLTSADDGMFIIAQTADSTTTVNSGATIAASTRGIIAFADSDTSVTNRGDITLTGPSNQNFSTGIAAGTGYGNATIVNSGDVALNTANRNANALYATSYGIDSAIDVTNSGAITITNSNATGISRGAALFENSGSADASLKFSSTGPISVTSAGIAEGVAAFGSGDVSIDVAAPIMVSGTTASGVRAFSFLGNLSIATDDVTVAASGPNAAGIYGFATLGSTTIDADGTIAVTGNGARGIVARGATGVTVTGAGDVSTTGNNANAVDVSSTGGPVDITVGNVSTAGSNSNGVAAVTSGDFDATVVTGDVTTTNVGFGSRGVSVYADAGDVSITTGSVSTAGIGAPGILGFSTTGATTIAAGDVSTTGSGEAINASGGAGASVTFASASTAGNYSSGVLARSSAGPVSVSGGDVTTTGNGANGIFAFSYTDGVSVTTIGTIATSGDNAQGVNAFGYAGDVVVNVNDVSTTGDNADAVNATSADGMVMVNTTGAISTEGANSRGIFISAATGAGVTGTAAGSISTLGDGSNAVDITTIAGPIDLTVGDITTAGELSGGVRAIGGTDGDVSITTGNVSTAGLAGSNYAFLPTATAIFATAQGLGNLTIDAGNVSTAGLGALGVSASAADGDVSVTTGDVATTGERADGVNAQSASGNVLVSTGSVSTAGDSAVGIYAAATAGGVSVDAGAVTTAGFNSTGILAFGGEGGVDVGFTSIATGGDFSAGVVALSAGGDVTVSGADITTTGSTSYAVYAASDVGNVAVTTTGTVASTGRAGTGIYAYSGTGNVTVNANNVTTVATDPTDTDTSRGAIVATGANATVVTTGNVTTAGQASYGGISDAIVVTGTDGNASATVNNVSTSGDASRAVVVTATEIASATVNGAVRTSGTGADAVFVDGDTAIVSVGTVGSVAATNGNSITLSSVTGSTLTNAGTIANNNGGFAVLALGGPITINNSGRLTSDIVLTSGDDVINNSGTFVVGPNPDFGAGVDTFNNSGTVLVGSGATAPVSPIFAGLQAFNNTGGLVDLRNGRAGDTLTLPGSFTASGNSRLGLDIQFGATNTADRLILAGAASGQTQVLLNNVGGQAGFDPGNTVLVQAGAASNADAFDLAGGFTDTGFVRNEVIYNPADFSFRLSGAPSDAAFRTLNYVEGARNLWLKSADVVSGQLRAQRDALWAYGGGEPSPRLWVQMHGSVETRQGGRDVSAFGQTRSVNTGFEQDYFGGQAGFDFGGGSGDKGGFAIGVTGGYINSSLNFARSPDRISFDVVNAGVYGSYTSGNFFVNALGKYDYYWADAKSFSAGFDQSFKGSSYGGRGEVGVRFGSDSFFVEPAASISYVRTDFDNFSVLGTQVRFDEEDGLRGRAGGRIGGQFDMLGSKAAVYVGGNYVHEFQGEDGVSFTNNGQTFSYINGRTRDYGEALLGLSVGQASGVSGFIEGSYIRSFKDDSAGRLPIEGAGGRAGLRIRF